MNELKAKYSEEVQHILAKYPVERKASTVMPLLFLAQRETGFINKQAILDVADISGLSSTDVDAVVGFYTLFHAEPDEGRYRLQVCTDLPCALRGAGEFIHSLCANMGIKVGETTPDGLFHIEEVTCLAGCHRAPMFQVQGDGEITYHENQTVETALALISELRDRVQKKEESL